MNYNRVFSLALFFSAATGALVAIFQLRLPPEVPLFYSRPWGKEQLAQPLLLLLPPAAAFLIFLLNLAWARTWAKEREFLSQILVLGGFVAVILSTITVIRILLLVG